MYYYYKDVKSIVVALTVFLVLRTNAQNLSLRLSTQDIIVLVDETQLLDLILPERIREDVNFTFHKQHPELIEIIPQLFVIAQNTTENKPICILGVSPGRLEVTANISPENVVDVNNIFVRITVANSWPLITISVIFGWAYFAAWTISFYPQIYINFKRKSVVGFHFDYISLNIVGYLVYGMFNIGLYWSSFIQEEYFNRYPRGLNPVLLNDVIFALHGIVATSFMIFQCIIYEKADQRVSTIARIILGAFGILIIIFAILAGTVTIHWLDFLYYCSYIKLTITLIKYIPQAVMNYRRKSTVGWSIGNILLDFTGGMLSMLQMIINAYNYDDWDSIFGDPTKFGLGLFSVLFDIVFIVQHYVLYRLKHTNTENIHSKANLEQLLTANQ